LNQRPWDYDDNFQPQKSSVFWLICPASALHRRPFRYRTIRRTQQIFRLAGSERPIGSSVKRPFARAIRCSCLTRPAAGEEVGNQREKVAERPALAGTKLKPTQHLQQRRLFPTHRKQLQAAAEGARIPGCTRTRRRPPRRIKRPAKDSRRGRLVAKVCAFHQRLGVHRPDGDLGITASSKSRSDRCHILIAFAIKKEPELEAIVRPSAVYAAAGSAEGRNDAPQSTGRSRRWFTQTGPLGQCGYPVRTRFPSFASVPSHLPSCFHHRRRRGDTKWEGAASRPPRSVRRLRRT